MAIAFVQEVHKTSGNASSQAGVQFSTVTTAGNTLIAVGNWSTGGAGSTYTDSQGDTFTVRKEVNDATHVVSMSVATAISITGGALSSVTVSFSACSSNLNVIGVAEYSGIGSFDIAAGQAASPSTTANSITSGAATPTGSSGLLLFGAHLDAVGSTNTITAGSGYTIRANTQVSGGGQAIAYEDQLQLSTGSTAATFTQKQGHSAVTILVAMDASVAGGATVRNPWTLTLTGIV